MSAAGASLLPAAHRTKCFPVAAWLLLTLATMTVLIVPGFLPWYDYLEWLLQGRIVEELLTGAPGTGYGLLPVPVPNLAAPLGIGLLALALPIEAAGRVLLVLGCLSFAYSYAFLVRRLQDRPTMIEFTGLVWVFGYFLYRGYVSYLFALPLVFLGIAVLHQLLDAAMSRARIAVLTVLDVLAFLSHLVAWAVLLLAVACYAAALARRHRVAAAAAILATTVPSVVLLAWYTIAAPGNRHISIYTSLRDKVLALAEPLQFFLRLDPYPGNVPALPAQVIVTLSVLLMLATGLRRPTLRSLRTPVAAAAIALLALALVSPVSNVNDLTKPDQRLLFPAVLLLMASARWKPSGRLRDAAVVAAVLAVLGLHLAELQSVQPPLQRLAQAGWESIPAGSSVTTVAVPSDGGCGTDRVPSIGVPALKWFDVERLLRTGQTRANLQETSAIRLQFNPRIQPGLTALTSSAALAANDIATATAAPPAYIEVIACSADLDTVQKQLGSRYRRVSVGAGFVILTSDW